MKPNVAKLGDAVGARRRELNMSQVDVWRNGGPSNSTLTGIENGATETVSAVTQRKLDRALGWKEGSAQRVLAGGEPTPIRSRDVTGTGGDDAQRDTVEVSVEHVAELVRQSRFVRNRLAHGNPGDLSPDALELLIRDAFAMTFEIEAFAARAIGPARLGELSEGPGGSRQDDDTPPAGSEYGLAARETPDGYQKGHQQDGE